MHNKDYWNCHYSFAFAVRLCVCVARSIVRNWLCARYCEPTKLKQIFFGSLSSACEYVFFAFFTPHRKKQSRFCFTNVRLHSFHIQCLTHNVPFNVELASWLAGCSCWLHMFSIALHCVCVHVHVCHCTHFCRFVGIIYFRCRWQNIFALVCHALHIQRTYTTRILCSHTQNANKVDNQFSTPYKISYMLTNWSFVRWFSHSAQKLIHYRLL